MNLFGVKISIELIRLSIGIGAVLGFIGLCALVLVLMERKVAGHFQRRPGPFEVGPHGALQTLVDGLKLMGKQFTVPAGADALLFWLAPILAFAPVAVSFLPIPFGPYLTVWELNLGIVLILAFSGLSVLALCLAGWASNNKYGLVGAARAVSQGVAYEIPLLLAVLAISFQTGSLNLSTITEAQGSWPWQWNFIVQPVAFFIFIVAMVGETNRAPFDMPEAESELTAGFHTEYSGMGFGLFFLGEYAAMVVICSVCTVLFLGGYKGPIVDGVWWFLIKVFLLVYVLMWFRWTYPRVRFDQLLNINWRWLIPLGIANLAVVALVVKIV